MKINEIIRERRQQKGMTLEQMAQYLGVTAPAVHKWEKGTSYPDITLLPALARLLGTDLNTLLSFKEELSPQEIALFLNHLSGLNDAQGFEAACHAASEKLLEYPTCYALILQTALWLDGSLLLGQTQETGKYQTWIESLYERVLDSPEQSLRDQAQSMLISKYMARKDDTKARELLDALPEASPVDKKQIQANLLIECGELEEAARLEEEKLLKAINDIQAILLTLMDIALKQQRPEDASAMAEISQKSARLFELWEYNSYTAHFQLYCALKNPDQCFQALTPLLRSLERPWNPSQSPLYRHLTTKTPEKCMGSRFRQALIQSMANDKDMDFLKNDPRFTALLLENSQQQGNDPFQAISPKL